MNCVYDSSFVGSLIIPDEKDSKAEKFHASLAEEDLIFTPQLFWYEISNMFYNLVRRKRYIYENILPFFNMIKKIGLSTDFEYSVEYSQKILHLCNEYKLSSYDAAYLELAKRKNATLCTLDVNLSIAAKKNGVAIIK